MIYLQKGRFLFEKQTFISLQDTTFSRYLVQKKNHGF